MVEIAVRVEEWMLKQVQHDGLRVLAYVSLLVIGATSLTAGTSKARNYEDIDPYWRSCPERKQADSGQISNMDGCVARSFKLADAEMNKVYRERLAEFNASQQQRLRKIQRKWLTTRDRDAGKCAGPWEPDGREYGFVYTSCLVISTVEQTSLLRKWK